MAVFWHSSSTSKFEDRSIFGLSDRAAKSLAFSGRRKCVISAARATCFHDFLLSARLSAQLSARLHALISVRLSAWFSAQLSAQLPARLSARLSARISARLSARVLQGCQHIYGRNICKWQDIFAKGSLASEASVVAVASLQV